jgi:hypothetical protein
LPGAPARAPPTPTAGLFILQAVIVSKFLVIVFASLIARLYALFILGVEMGEQAKTHCAVRLKKVIEGEQAASLTRSGA